ncbi:SDR family oxidoreductase [Mycobacterium sp. E1747]|uniref:SDR family NAD(P)-dependent oxidoreductase n=1 Tax=Mycobacterium sp. E1747 TaxID=1834128 RepID=UPI0007FE0544|nr:SDR family NAD(P)-dependent oxidoreductase [Mycobacterium sp. E1747]OBH11174.1 hypothetical protein A5695_20190 [Mycobacterium sp. E1747]
MTAARDRIVAERRLTALVTGASSGIGADFARLLAEKDHDLVLVARRTGPMDELADELRHRHGVRVEVIGADLADPAVPAMLADQTAELGLEVDVLVNNAGLMLDGHMLKFDWQQHETVNRVMALAPAELIYRFLPGMLRRGWGQVINIASAAGFMPATPFNTFYGPIKNYLVVLTRTLDAEYGAAGVTFTVACPGPVRDTGIVDNTDHGADWSRLGPLLCTPRQVTSAAYRTAEAGRTVTGVDPASRSIAALGHLLPAGLFARVISAAVMFASKEKRVSSAAEAGVATTPSTNNAKK